MNKDELGNPDEQEQELELEPTESETVVQGSDPLDGITDVNALKVIAENLPAFDSSKHNLKDLEVDEIRAEVKKIRSIGQRHKEEVKSEAPKETKVEVPQGDFVTKSDLELSRQKTAIRLATISQDTDSDEVKEKKVDMLENWEGVRQFYRPRKGKDTSEDILEDIDDAYTLFKKRQITKEEEPDTTDLTASKVEGGTATAPAPKTKVKGKDLPNFNTSLKPKDWYPSE